MKFSRKSTPRTLASSMLLIASISLALASCAGVHSIIPASEPDSSQRAGTHGSERAQSSTDATTGMCSIYGGFGSLSFCYEMAEASGTVLTDSSGAGHNGTITSSGVTYGAAGLTANSSSAETTNGSTGSMTSGYDPGSGSFSVSFFVALRSNGNNFGHLAATGAPGTSSPSSGWNININENSSNTVFAKLGYGSGQTTVSGVALPLNTPENVTLTYNASSKVATLCVGNTSSPTCVTGTLPDAYVASGNPVVFGGGASYAPANATFDEASFWQGTVLSTSQVDAIAGYATAGMCPIYAGFGSPSFCYNMDESSGTTLTDSSGAGHNGTISSSGVSYEAAGLTSNNEYALGTNGSSGSLTSGFSPSTGSFSVAFFVDLLKNADNFGHVVASGEACSACSSSTGFNVDVNTTSNNDIFAKLGYGSGETTLGGVNLAKLSTDEGVVLTYDSSTRGATLCVGNTSTPACVTATLPSAYEASGSPIVFGGGSTYAAQDATFDSAAYWQGTVLTSAQIDAITSYASGGSSSEPTPTPTPAPTSTSTPTSTPKPAPTSSVYAPPGGTTPYFPASCSISTSPTRRPSTPAVRPGYRPSSEAETCR
jgi:hypothetical protein